MLVATAPALVCCGGGGVYRSETFAADSPFQHTFESSVAAACAASRSALLSQGYRILESSASGVKAKKEYQRDEDIHDELEVAVTCEPRGARTVVYASAVQQRYEVKKSRHATSISVPSIGSLSLPGSAAAEALIKTGSETVTDRDYYDRFFALVARLLGLPPRPPS